MTGWQYQGTDGFYRIEVDGEQVGIVASGYDSWTAALWHDNRWKWTAPTRRQATQQLIDYLTDQP